jgi:hypothetical protein
MNMNLKADINNATVYDEAKAERIAERCAVDDPKASYTAEKIGQGKAVVKVVEDGAVMYL